MMFKSVTSTKKKNNVYNFPNQSESLYAKYAPSYSIANSSDVYICGNSEYNSDTDIGGGETMDTEKYLDRLDQDRRDMERRLREDRQQMEQRITEERRLSEERIEARFSEVMSKMDKAIDRVDENKKWIIGLCLATILGIAAMVVTVVVSLLT